MNNRDRLLLAISNVLHGMLRLALGKPDGLKSIDNTPAAFSASIAPLIAFPLVGAILLGVQDHWILATSLFLSRLCGVLVQPIIVEFASGRIGRREHWLATTTALNWSIWVIFPLIPAGALLSAALVGVGLDQEIALIITISLVGAYMLWLQWFILRTGLSSGPWRAAGLLLAMNVIIAMLYLLPYLFHPDLLKLTMSAPSG